MPRSRTQILDDVLDHAPIQVWGVDADLNLTYLDGAAVESLLGGPARRFVGRPLRSILSESSLWVLERHRKAFEGEEQGYEVRWWDTVFWVHLSPPVEGGAEEVHGIAVDITELHETQERLRDVEDMRAFALRASGAGHWYLELDPEVPEEVERARLHLSPEVLGFIGFAPGEGPATVRDWHARILDRDLPGLAQAAKEHLAGKAPTYQVEYRIRHRDGSVHWIRSHGRVERDDDGRPVRWAGLDFDVTRERSAQRRWDHLLRHLDCAVVYQDTQGVFIAANDAATELLGIDRDDLLGRHPGESGLLFLRPDGSPLRPMELPPMIALREHRIVRDVKIGVPDASAGAPRWLRATSIPRLGAEGEPVEVFTSLEEWVGVPAREAAGRGS